MVQVDQQAPNKKPWVVEVKRNSLDDGPGILQAASQPGCVKVLVNVSS